MYIYIYIYTSNWYNVLPYRFGLTRVLASSCAGARFFFWLCVCACPDPIGQERSTVACEAIGFRGACARACLVQPFIH